MSFKPEGYTSVAPYLIVDDADTSLAFVKSVFGCEPIRVTRNDAGKARHAEVRIDDTVVMLGSAPGGGKAHVHVYVDDPEALMVKALAAGGVLVREVMRGEDGDLRGGVEDGSGTTWWLARGS